MERAELMSRPLSATDLAVEQTNYVSNPATTEEGSDADTETGDPEKNFDLISKFWVDIVSDTDCEE